MKVLNRSVAHEVAQAFLDARTDRHDATVDYAYRQLVQQSDLALPEMTRRYGIGVVFTRCPAPYASDREMIDAARTERILEITMADVERDRRHPLLGCEPGGAYDRFRALHDLSGHVVPGLGFDRDGEYAAWLTQERLYSSLARRALASELHAEHSVRWTTGEVCDHKPTLLDPSLIARARTGKESSPHECVRCRPAPPVRRSSRAGRRGGASSPSRWAGVEPRQPLRRPG